MLQSPDLLAVEHPGQVSRNELPAMQRAMILDRPVIGVSAAIPLESLASQPANVDEGDAGLRLGDICQLEWDSFSVKNKFIVWTDKRDRRVALDLDPRLADVIAAIAPINSQYVFPEERALYKDTRRKANLSTYFRRICAAVDIHGKTFHDLRSSFIVDCKKRGLPMEHIAESVGHRSTTTTKGYIPKGED